MLWQQMIAFTLVQPDWDGAELCSFLSARCIIGRSIGERRASNDF
jgi:hypothetical protein